MTPDLTLSTLAAMIAAEMKLNWWRRKGWVW